MTMLADVALLGGGGAGLSLLLAIERAAIRRGQPFPSIVIIDPVRRAGADRTWCFWQPAQPAQPADVADPLVHRSWSRIELFDSEARPITIDLDDQRYVMLRSQDLYAEAERVAERMQVRWIQAEAGALEERDERVTIAAGTEEIAARWVFDSRPAPPQRAPLTSLLQHFRGWTVHFERPVFDPQIPTLMDFRVPQPSNAVAFGYCLPLDEHRALVEYTEFGRRRLTDAAYDVALRAYLSQRWGEDYEVEAVEDGVIPMTDAGYDVRAGQRIFRIGTAGGATRGSTGYTLAAARRQASVIAERLLDGQTPEPPPPYPKRHRWMDAVLLRAIDRRRVDGPRLFTSLFEHVPAGELIAFLDGLSTPSTDLAVMRAAPRVPMMRAGAEDTLARLIQFRTTMTRLSAGLIRSVARRYLK